MTTTTSHDPTLPEAPPPRCVWEEDENGTWETSCEHLYEFNDAGPGWNGFNYCPFCGKKIKESEVDDSIVHLAAHIADVANGKADLFPCTGKEFGRETPHPAPISVIGDGETASGR